MASPSAAPRRPRASVDPEDLLLLRAAEWSEWGRRNARLVIGVTVVALALLGGLLFYRIWQGQQAERAATEFAAVQATAESGNAALAQRDLERFIGRHGATPEGSEARIALAQIHMNRGEPKRAIPVLQPLARDLGRTLGPQAAMLLGAAQAEAGDRPAAIATYLRAADHRTSPAFLRDEALRNAAMLREQAGEYREAAELYRRLVQAATEGSFERTFYEMRLAEAEGRARGR
jgi:hypothetical protein